MSDLCAGRKECDYLGEFLEKLTRLSIEQCADLGQILQRSSRNDPIQRVIPRIFSISFQLSFCV